MEKITPQYGAKNNGHYSPGIVAGGMLYVSGQLSRDPDTGKVAEGGADVHAKQALANLDSVLQEAGCTKDDVVQCRVYVTDVNNWDAVNAVYAEYFGDHRPARIMVPVPALHFGCLVEIEAVAEVK